MASSWHFVSYQFQPMQARHIMSHDPEGVWYLQIEQGSQLYGILRKSHSCVITVIIGRQLYHVSPITQVYSAPVIMMLGV